MNTLLFSEGADYFTHVSISARKNTRVMLPYAKKYCAPTTQKSCVVYELFSPCGAPYVGRTTQRVADRIKQHVPMSIRKKSYAAREQLPRICKNNKSKINCETAIGQHLIANPECAKTYTDNNFQIIGQARSSFHLSNLESVYIKTQNPVMCKQNELVFSLGLFKYTMLTGPNWSHLGPIRRILSRVTASYHM